MKARRFLITIAAFIGFWVVVFTLASVVSTLASVDEEAETPIDVVWDNNSFLVVDSNDRGIVWNNYDTYDYVFDANSDPLIFGKVLIHWLKTNPEATRNINLSVPCKDKAEYDAILVGNDGVKL